LRQTAFGRVDKEHHAVNHLQHAFDFAAEVRVSRRVDDVDLHVAITNGGVLRHDSNAALTLEIHGVHHALAHLLVLAEGA
jgi:hypothetical protein